MVSQEEDVEGGLVGQDEMAVIGPVVIVVIKIHMKFQIFNQFKN